MYLREIERGEALAVKLTQRQERLRPVAQLTNQTNTMKPLEYPRRSKTRERSARLMSLRELTEMRVCTGWGKKKLYQQN